MGFPGAITGFVKKKCVDQNSGIKVPVQKRAVKYGVRQCSDFYIYPL